MQFLAVQNLVNVPPGVCRHPYFLRWSLERVIEGGGSPAGQMPAREAMMSTSLPPCCDRFVLEPRTIQRSAVNVGAGNLAVLRDNEVNLLPAKDPICAVWHVMHYWRPHARRVRFPQNATPRSTPQPAPSAEAARGRGDKVRKCCRLPGAALRQTRRASRRCRQTSRMLQHGPGPTGEGAQSPAWLWDRRHCHTRDDARRRGGSTMR